MLTKRKLFFVAFLVTLYKKIELQSYKTKKGETKQKRREMKRAEIKDKKQTKQNKITTKPIKNSKNKIHLLVITIFLACCFKILCLLRLGSQKVR